MGSGAVGVLGGGQLLDRTRFSGGVTWASRCDRPKIIMACGKSRGHISFRPQLELKTSFKPALGVGCEAHEFTTHDDPTGLHDRNRPPCGGMNSHVVLTVAERRDCQKDREPKTPTGQGEYSRHRLAVSEHDGHGPLLKTKSI